MRRTRIISTGGLRSLSAPTLALGLSLTVGLLLTVGCQRNERPGAEALEEGLGRYRTATAPEGGGAQATPGPASDDLARAPAGAVADTPPAASPARAPAKPAAPAPRYLQVTVVDGAEIAEKDAMGGDSDPYVRVEYDGRSRDTSVDEDTIDPVWHDTFVFEYVRGAPLVVSLFDSDPTPASDQLLGTVTIFPDRDPGPGRRELKFKGGQNGRVRLDIELLP